MRVGAGGGDARRRQSYHYQSRALWRLSRDRGVFVALPSPEEAAAYEWTRPSGRGWSGSGRARSSAPERRWSGKLRTLVDELGVQEVAILGTAHDPAARRASYALIAEAAGLRAEQVAMAAAASERRRACQSCRRNTP